MPTVWTSKKTLARQAVRTAFTVRRKAGIARTDPVCVFDLAEELGVEVKFRPETSLEGMYVKEAKGLVLISTLRPRGRRAFTCAHELGHHFSGHGTSVDEYLKDRARSDA